MFVGVSYASLTYFGDLLRRTVPKFVQIDTVTLEKKIDPPHPRGVYGVIYC